MKKFIEEKYADLVLQVCSHYKNSFPASTDRTAQAVQRSLGILDKYSCYILGMGYMLETEDIPYLKEYITELAKENQLFKTDVLEKINDYLSFVEREDVF